MNLGDASFHFQATSPRTWRFLMRAASTATDFILFMNTRMYRLPRTNLKIEEVIGLMMNAEMSWHLLIMMLDDGNDLTYQYHSRPVEVKKPYISALLAAASTPQTPKRRNRVVLTHFDTVNCNTERRIA
eukprot:3825044-Pleurochrysis_carterae.AAC.1